MFQELQKRIDGLPEPISIHEGSCLSSTAADIDLIIVLDDRELAEVYLNDFSRFNHSDRGIQYCNKRKGYGYATSI